MAVSQWTTASCKSCPAGSKLGWYGYSAYFMEKDSEGRADANLIIVTMSFARLSCTFLNHVLNASVGSDEPAAECVWAARG